jgi:HK97 gp10 family phage protein
MADVKWNGEKLYQRIVDTTILRMERLGNQMVKDIQSSMKPGTGRLYKSRTGVGMHRASKPYYPPAPDTKELKNSIDHRVWFESSEVILRVGTDVEYSKYLEIGTSRMLPRPFLRPCLERFRPKIVAIIGKTGSIRVMPMGGEGGFGEGSMTS